MPFTHKWIRFVPVNLSFVLLAAVSSMTLTAHAATSDNWLSDSPAVSWQVANDEAISPATEREIVVNKLRSHGFSEREARLLLPTMSSEQLRQLANAETLTRSGAPSSRIIALLTVIFLVVLAHKLTDGFGKRSSSTDSQLSPNGVNPGKTVKRRADSISSEIGAKRPHRRRKHRKTLPIQSRETGAPVANLKKSSRRGR
ncbi:MAG: hypothetical protein NDI73_09240 [Desulfuromonadales bacterium]|nr:hypothetical protein [Desulfuromonadales bacterium]